MIKTQTLKGFRDFLPAEAIKRQFVVDKIKGVFARFGFDPLETPTLEYAETLLGKYGKEADKLLYLFTDNGKRKVGLRYDQTVPLSRVISQYQNELTFPFKRYQIQPVWRAENTQKGRYREFLQCDIDIIGSLSPLSDAEIIDCTLTCYSELGFNNLEMVINDRTIFDKLGLTKQDITILDKLEKIGKDAVILELKKIGRLDAAKLLDQLKIIEPTQKIWQISKALKSTNYKDGVDFRFDPFLARGLDYYTSTIFELKIKGDTAGSLAGGGRYDNLIGIFSGKDYPAVGIAFGFDRTLEALENLNLLPSKSSACQILITVFSLELLSSALFIAKTLRVQGLNTDLYLNPEDRLDKQLKYADRKGIPYVIIQGPQEEMKNKLVLKNMQTKKQEELTIDEVIDKLKSN